MIGVISLSDKTNYDGVMFDESDEAGLGVVIRNSEGQVLATLSEKIKKPPSVVTLELLATRRAAVVWKNPLLVIL